MPREYIARLIYDKDHESIILLSNPSGGPVRGEIFFDPPSNAIDVVDTSTSSTTKMDVSLVVIGGITLRRFAPEKPFLEIVFCAISSAEQVRGFGSFLMNMVKTWARQQHPHIQYFLTYADNYAVGYFKKQGFSRTITLDRAIWGGFIKDYDGGTLMECKLIMEITDYRDVKLLLAAQRSALLSLIKEKLPGPFIRRPGISSSSFPVNASEIPGLENKPFSLTTSNGNVGRTMVKDTLAALLVDLQTHHSAWPFLEPVKISDVPDYLTVVNEPMDLKTVGTRVFSGYYHDVDSFINDVLLIFNNCRAYNQEYTPYYKCANDLECYFRERLKSL